MMKRHRPAAAIRAACCAWVCMFVVLTLPAVAQAQSFTRITDGIVVNDAGASRSVNWIDADRNGTLDLFVSNGPASGERAFFYLNDGPPSYTFTKVINDPIVSDVAKSDGCSWGDADNDGDPDAFVVTWYGDVDMFYLGNGDGTFSKVTTGEPVTTGAYSESCTWGDYDNDGNLDLYVTNSGDQTAEANFLYHGHGDGTFTRILTGFPSTDVYRSRGATWIDFDRDGDTDLFVANEANQPNNLYRNLLRQTGTADFARVSSGPIANDSQSSFSGSWGDYDNDGDPDLFVANTSNQNNALYRHEVGDGFTKITSGPQVNDGGYSVCGAWGDFENDGDLDLFVTNAFGGGRKVNFLYRNLLIQTGTPDFEKITTGTIVTELGWSYGCAWGDYDADGDLDLFVAKTWNNTENNALFRNDNANGNHWMEIRCEGGLSNRSGIGAEVSVSATIGGTRIRQMRTIEGQSGYCGQNLVAHFGLGDAVVADTVKVRWSSGTVDILTAVAVDQPWILREGEGVADVGEGFSTPTTRNRSWCAPNPFQESTTIGFEMPMGGESDLRVYTPSGRLIRTLSSGWAQAGRHDAVWDGNDASGRPVAPGAYLYKIVRKGETIGGRVVVIR